MITLAVLGIFILIILLAIVTLFGGFLIAFLDPIIAILIIWLVVKLIQLIKELCKK